MNGHKIIGIDIGLAGAVAVLDTEGILETIYDMPTLADGTKNRRTISAPLLHNILKENRAEHAFVEYVGARPGEGAVGAFAFGRARGIIEGCLGSCRIPTTFLTPPSWKRAVGLPWGTNKDASRSMAIARWPQHAEWFKRKMDNGRSDAALIAVAGLIRAGKLK
jgi:crossover junction endodeoxyribonuclease RuvC